MHQTEISLFSDERAAFSYSIDFNELFTIEFYWFQWKNAFSKALKINFCIMLWPLFQKNCPNNISIYNSYYNY